MKKLSIFAVAIAAIAFTACGGKKGGQTTEVTDSVKTFEQAQVEAKIKAELDSLATEVGKLKALPIFQDDDNSIKLTDQEKQVKPDYLTDPAAAEKATTLAEKYRMLSVLGIDRRIAELYDMPTDAYKAALGKLRADINDPSFKEAEDSSNLIEISQKLYDAMEKNGRINYYWQMTGAALVEEIYVLTQNTDKFITAFDDEAASNITYRIILLSDAVKRLADYDPELESTANAVKALEPLNATTVNELKTQLGQTKEKIAEARAALVK